MTMKAVACEVPPANRDDEVRILHGIVDTLRLQHAQLLERYEWLEAMINHVPDFIYAKDLEGRFLFANRAVVINNGFESVDELIGRTDAEIHPNANAVAHQIDEIERRVIELGQPDLGIEERRMKGDGWLMMSRVPLRDRGGAVIGVVGASRDITARKRAEEFMTAQTTLLQSVAKGIELGSLLKDAQSLLQNLFPNRLIAFSFGPDHDPASQERLIYPIISRNGLHQGQLSVSTTQDCEAGLGEFFAGIAQTIGIAIDRNRDTAHIAYLAEHDALTGLPNRTLLNRNLDALLKAGGTGLTVAFIDLDDFKLVNDSFGHAAGDELLKVIGTRLSTAVADTGLVARIGGDEFIVVLKSAGSPAVERLKTIHSDLARPVRIADTDLQVSTSIGVAFSGEHGESAGDLYANADAALYQAKRCGRNGIKIFSASMVEAARSKLSRIEELRRAIERDEFVLHFQPQKTIRTGEICGLEALVRWQHPDEGLLMPGAFISLAEETGLIVAIGAIVLTKTCAQISDWLEKGHRPMRVAVNVSARQFRETSLCDQVATALREAHIDPNLLELEITESLIMEDVEGAIARMHELKQIGVSLSIDDFGTGYSSLSTLKRFPISRLKIDKSFIVDVPASAGDNAITSAIISLGQTLQLEVVAEGVETTEQAEFLANAGCDAFQGYLFARPLPPEALANLLPRDDRPA